MLIPVRCFTCGKVIGNKWNTYLAQLGNGSTEEQALDNLGLRRYCCRTMILSHVNLIDKLLLYNVDAASASNSSNSSNAATTDEAAATN
ncbi:MAG: DNA-directed RNA polymerase subunit N [Acidimicrobiaceae bacterium]|nr:DNA-directed RNA polymerase subunit N [Acidimicrobiaceae bacterium]|tara:strand:+ start:708 stop:974 length:267 start_codon:yes stop_codon:yes gene_type:complete